MLVHVFRAEDRMFAFTAIATGENLPPRAISEWRPFKTIELARGQSTPGVDVDACLEDIARYGFHVTNGHVRVPPTSA
jgi:hypothetical protein